MLQRDFSDHINGYVSYSQGYNSGGVSAAVIGATRTLFPYKPSTLNNTEIGMRSDLAKGRCRFNWTVFDMIWQDLQAAGVVKDPVTGVQIPTLVTTNVGEAEAKGVEVELTFVPTESLLINVGTGYLDTGYTKLAPGTMSGHLPLTFGTEFEDAPHTSWTVGAATHREAQGWCVVHQPARLQLPGPVLASAAVPARDRIPGDPVVAQRLRATTRAATGTC